MTFSELRVAVGRKRWSERLILAAGLGSLLACSLSGCAPEGFDPNDPAGVLGTTSQELTGFDPLPQGLDWEVLSRFPVDSDGDGVREERTDEAYVLPEAHGGHPTILKGCPSGDTAAYAYLWTVEGKQLAATDCNAHHVFPRQGSFPVELTVTSRATGASAVYRRQVQVKDWFIVALGDSYGSGEGNPDVPRYLEEAARWADQRCHRSFKAGAAVAARMLEEEDPHSSVTFFSLACSGANISLDSFGEGDLPMGSGLLGGYRGIEPANEPEFLPAQVDQLHTLARSRKIDAILVSGGGNDMEFGKLGEKCVVDPGCHNNGDLHQLLATRRNELPGRYDALAQRLREYFPSTEVYLTEYPDPTTGLHGETCERILEDVKPIFTTTPFEVNRDESNFLRSSLLTPLNEMGKAKAQELGWNYVGGIAQAFSGYGYCSPVRKFRHSWESVTLQGPDDRTKTKGTLHPNEDGHLSYARQLADTLRRTQKMGSGSPLFGPTVYSTEGLDWGYGAERTWVDVDGDGRADYCRFIGDAGTMRVQCTLSVEEGFGTTITSQVLDPGWPAGRAFVDANGDRRADFCRVVGNSFRSDSAVACTLNLGTAAESTILSARGLDWGYEDGRTWADVDADGRADYCRLVGNSNFLDSRIACTPSTGSGFGSTWLSPVLDWGYPGTRMWSDVDSDGRADFCRYSGDWNQPTLQCNRSTGTSFGGVVSTRLSSPGATEGRAWVSLNGDSHKDFCRVVGSTNVGVECVLGTSSGFGQVVSSSPDLALGVAHSRAWVDVSGDGKADFCREVGTGNDTRIRCALGTGSAGFAHEVESGRLDPGLLYGRAWVDVTRDGRADYCRVGGPRNFSANWVMCSSVSYRGPVQEMYVAAGGTGGLGVATTGELFYAGGQYQHFERGAVYWNYSRGTFVVRDAFWDKWRQKGLESGVLGAPIGDAIQSTDGSGWLQHFERGTILLHPEMGAREVHGSIRDRYAQLGWERGVLGYPKTDERTSWTGRGTFIHFQGGSLFSTSGIIYSVQGALRDRYSALSFEQGPLGFPVAEQQCSYSSCVQRFEAGAFYQRGGGTTHAIHGWVYGAYRNEGEHTGRLGYPEGSVSVSSSSQTATFEEGLISCSAANSCQVIRFGP